MIQEEQDAAKKELMREELEKSVGLKMGTHSGKSMLGSLVPVKTAFVKTVPFSELPVKLARSTMAFVKSVPSNLESIMPSVK